MKPGSCSPHKPPRRARGFTLIDVLVLIVLVGTIAAGMTVLFGRLSTQSAETMRMEQSLLLAQALLEEVRMMPFTTCDPNPAKTNCTGTDGLGPEGGETRYGANRFDGVTDYQGFTMPGVGCPAGVCAIDGTRLDSPGGALTGCSASVTVTPQAVAGIAAFDGSGRPQAVLIGVTVSCPGIGNVLVQGIRTRHAPTTY